MKVHIGNGLNGNGPNGRALKVDVWAVTPRAWWRGLRNIVRSLWCPRTYEDAFEEATGGRVRKYSLEVARHRGGVIDLEPGEILTIRAA